MSKNQLTGTTTQPQYNRKFCQFNNDQYCKSSEQHLFCSELKACIISNVRVVQNEILDFRGEL